MLLGQNSDSLDNRQVMVIPALPNRRQRVELGIEVEHRRSEPIMLIGHGSSGTSICSGLIRKYCGVAMANESQFMIRFEAIARKSGGLSDPRELKLFIEELLKERFFIRAADKYGFRPTAAQIISGTATPTCSGVYRSLYRLLAEHMQMSRWADKSPEYMDDLPVLGELFPDAQYIHVIRDGRDVAMSVLSRYFGANNIIMAAIEWRDTVRKAQAFLKTIRPEQQLTIQYEDMLENPVNTLQRVHEFLEAVPGDPDMFDRVSASIWSELKPGMKAKWKQQMSVRDREVFEAIAGPELRACGYETEFEDPRAPSWLTMQLAPISDRVHHWMSIAALKDTIYRASMRLKNRLAAWRLRMSALRTRRIN